MDHCSCWRVDRGKKDRDLLCVTSGLRMEGQSRHSQSRHSVRIAAGDDGETAVVRESSVVSNLALTNQLHFTIVRLLSRAALVRKGHFATFEGLYP